ncbi:MAG: recombinase family protein [Coriobacteriales bacterium]
MFCMNQKRQLPKDVRVCCYLRMSREERKNQDLYGGDVLSRHAQLLEMTAAENGVAIEKVYREVASGSTLSERPAMRELIDAVADGAFDAIAVIHPDRLSRGDEQLQGTVCRLLRAKGIFLICPGYVYDALFPQDMAAIRQALSNSRGEWEAYCRRMQTSIALSCLNGSYTGNLVGMGYSKQTLENGIHTLVPNKDAPTVHKIFELYADGMSGHAIANHLTDMGIAPPWGKPGDAWSAQTVLRILDNEVYIGISVRGKNKKREVFSSDAFNDKKVRYVSDTYLRGKGVWEPIIEKELWDRVRARRKKAVPVKQGKLKNIFAGLMRCGECGKPMNLTWKKDILRFGHLRRKRGCTQKGARHEVVVGEFVNALKESLRDFEVQVTDDSAVRKRSQALEAVDNLEQQLAVLAKRDKRLIEMRADEGLTAEEFAESRAEVRQLREAAEERLSRTKEVLDQEVDVQKLSLSVHEAIDMINDPDVSAQAKNDFLRTFIDHITYWNTSERGSNDELRLDIVFK